MDTPNDLLFLKSLEETDPEFFKEYVKKQLNLEKDVLSIKDCATILGVCPNTIGNYIRSGMIKASFVGKSWQIKNVDFLAFKNSVVVKRGRKNRSIVCRAFETKETKETKDKKDMKSKFVYRKATQRSVTDFLHNWSKSRSAGFALETICRYFNEVSEIKTNEAQMSNILSALRKKDIVIRKGKGLYQVSPSLNAHTEQGSSEQAPNTHNEQEPANQISQSQPAGIIVDADIETMSSRSFSRATKKEKLAVESFIRNNCNPETDFIFTISDVSREYPHLERKKLGKACHNMLQNGHLQKGSSLGSYVRKAKVITRKSERNTQVCSNDFMEKIRKIMESNLDPELKTEFIKNLS